MGRDFFFGQTVQFMWKDKPLCRFMNVIVWFEVDRTFGWFVIDGCYADGFWCIAPRLLF